MTQDTAQSSFAHTVVQHPVTYLVTGGAGFIGSHLSTALVERGHRVLVIDNLSTGRLENIQHLLTHPHFRFVQASITDTEQLNELAEQANVIIHLAAAVGVKLIVQSAVNTIRANVLGTEAVLQAALRNHAKVLLASTSEVYGKSARVPFNENDDIVLGPTSLTRWGYAASKVTDEFLALAYYREMGLPVVIFRLFNTVGPRQSGRYGMVIPRFVQQALRGEPVIVHGDGQQSRCFVHVSDAVRAIIGLSDCPEALGQVFNIGSTEEVTISELAYKVLAYVAHIHPQAAHPPDAAESENLRQRITFVPYEHDYPVGFEDMRRRVPNTAKIEAYIGWEPQRSLNDVLHDVIASFSEQLDVEMW